IVWKLGFYYNTRIAFAVHGYDQRVFFAAIFTNWIALVACATIAAAATRALIPTGGETWPLLGGALCFFDFFAQQGVLAGMSEGVSWLLVAIGFLGWVRRSLQVVAIILCLSIIQRETIPIVFGALSLFMLRVPQESRRFHVNVLAISVVAFLAYIGMRLAYSPLPGNEQQLSPTSFLYLLSHWNRLATREGAFQVFLSQNLLICLGGITALTVLAGPGAPARPRSAIDPTTVALLLTAFVLTAVGIGTLSQSNNIGRVLSILTPITAPLLAKGLFRLFPPQTEPPSRSNKTQSTI
ncbi:MAG TPA: hypothetical protein VGI30_10610, partial [Caulobacteraceae bacterium]